MILPLDFRHFSPKYRWRALKRWQFRDNAFKDGRANDNIRFQLLVHSDAGGLVLPLPRIPTEVQALQIEHEEATLLHNDQLDLLASH